MKIESGSAQINVNDSLTWGGVNINRAASGSGADLCFWSCVAYLAKRKDDNFVHVIVVPSERWKQDLIDEGWEILGDLKTLSDPVRGEA